MGGDRTVSKVDMEAHDRETRRLAQREFRRPLVVEAGAGTGKTTTLTARIVVWSLGLGWERAEAYLRSHEMDRIAELVLDGIVAITFTDAAASEMSCRVADALAEVEKGRIPCGVMAESLSVASDGVNRSRARALLGRLDRLSVMTIHAFCRRLLTKYPIEAGLHPDFTVDAEGFALEQVVREVVEDAISTGYEEPGDPHLLALAANGYGPKRVADALMRLASEAVSPKVLEEDPFSPARIRCVCEEAAGEFLDFLGRWGDLLGGVKRSPMTVSVMKAMEATLEGLKRVAASVSPSDDLGILCAWVRERWTENLLNGLKDWGKGKFKKSEADALGPSAHQVPARAASLHAWLRHLMRMDPEMLRHACAVLGTLLRRVGLEMRARGIQTFTGLLKGARDLLVQNPEIASSLRRSIHQLLVDEFQDTDRLQCDIIRLIALDGPAEERPGLFVVGDPKQSIYGWRNADLEAYEDFVSELTRCGGERHFLVVNFRSAPIILEEVERIVAPVMIEERGFQPSFQPLLPCEALVHSPGFTSEPRAPVEYWVSWALNAGGEPAMDKTPARKAAEMEAEALAKEILSLHWEHDVAWQDIGVLLRSTGDLDIYLTMLRHFDIPYMVEGDKNYYRRREIIEASALFRCIVDPHDHLALVTLLRSAMVGVPDAAWIPLWTRSFPEMVTELRKADSEIMARLRAVVEEVAQDIPKDIPGIGRVAGWGRALISALEDLALLRESFEADPADLFVTRMRSLFMQEATESARYLGLYRLANLDRFFRQLTDALGQGGGDPQGILRAMRVGVTRFLEAEEGRPKGELGDAVEVMTIHKAKGLDFKHVFLMQLHRGSRQEDAEEDTVAWHEGKWEWNLLGLPTLGFGKALERRKRVAQAELVRTLYVAATRAKDRLVLAGRWPARVSRKPLHGAKTHMDLLQWRIPEAPPLQELLGEGGNGNGQARLDAAQARWVFLGLLGSEPVTSPGASTRIPVPSWERVRSDFEALRNRVEKARAVMARPFSGPASGESHEALHELLGATRDTWDEVAGGPPLSRAREAVAMAVGSVIHRALENLDFDSEIALELDAKRSLLATYLRPFLNEDQASEALERARFVWDRFAQGPLLPRLLGLRGHILARELPVLLPPAEGHGPVGFVAGTIDLLYRDPDSGRIVVADYKTDCVEGEEALSQRSRIYAPQINVYLRAVREALRLSEEPRAELWFLHAGRIVVVEATQSGQG